MSMNYFYDDADRLIGDDFEKKLSAISPQRKQRVQSYKREQDKRLCLAATLLLDKALSKYGLRERDMIYAFNEHGKPYFENNTHLHFSLSHSGNYVAAAVSDCEIGCDIQKTEAVDMKLAERFFTRSEREYIKNQDDFFRVWVLKESFIKAVGRGLNLPLNAFCVESLNAKPYVFFDNQRYSFLEKRLEDYHLAVCSILRKL